MGFNVSGCLDVEAYVKIGDRSCGGIGDLWRRKVSFKCAVVDCNDSYRSMAVKIKCLEMLLICSNVSA